MQTQPEGVLIIGGGIGGLALAVALRNKGIAADVREKAPAFREIGSGVVLSPNGMKAIDRLGPAIGTEVRDTGQPNDPHAPFPFLAWNGKLRSSQTFGDLTSRYGAPMVSILRADLHAILRRAAGDTCLRANARLVDFEQDPAGVTAVFVDGSRVRADLLVGADGLRSTVRARLHGDEPPRYLGISSIRGISEGLDHPHAHTGFLTTGPGIQIFASPIGNQRLYWALTINAPQRYWPTLNPAEVRDSLLQRLAGWHAPVREMISGTDPGTLVLTDIHDRKPLKHWSRGRVTLLGDAAHPMSPFLGQGANMALEDAVVLADCLAHEPDAARALARYEQRRVERTSRMVNLSRQIGMLGQIENRLLCWMRDLIMPLAMRLTDQDKQNDWLFGYNPLAVGRLFHSPGRAMGCGSVQHFPLGAEPTVHSLQS